MFLRKFWKFWGFYWCFGVNKTPFHYFSMSIPNFFPRGDRAPSVLGSIFYFSWWAVWSQSQVLEMIFALKIPIVGARGCSEQLSSAPLRNVPSRGPIGKQNIPYCSLQNPKVGQLFVEIIYPWKMEIFANYWEKFLLNINFL